MHKERALLDKKEKLKEEVKWLQQTLSHLTINSSSPPTNPAVQAVIKVLSDKKKKITVIVS